MRVLLALHHPLNPNLGAPGATLSLGYALEMEGCKVEYFGCDEAFVRGTYSDIEQAIRFPWRVAAFLNRHAGEFEVLDISTGDNWVWATTSRRQAKKNQAMFTRSHGLEHMADQRLRQDVRANGMALSWKYPLYHGGFRLWEVRQSLRLADHAFFLNDADRDYAVRNFRMPKERISVLPNGINPLFFDARGSNISMGGSLRLAFIGRWTRAKGADALAKALTMLAHAGVNIGVTVLGSMCEPDSIRKALPASMLESLRIEPHYLNVDLPKLLAGHAILAFPSLSEGFSLALVEAMACGLAPVATPVGGSCAVIKDGENGVIVPVDNPEALFAAIHNLAQDRVRLLAMRCSAQRTAQAYTWKSIGAQTIAVYEQVLARKGAMLL